MVGAAAFVTVTGDLIGAEIGAVDGAGACGCVAVTTSVVVFLTGFVSAVAAGALGGVGAEMEFVAGAVATDVFFFLWDDL